MVAQLSDDTGSITGAVLHLDTGTRTWFAEIGADLWRLQGRHAPLLMAGFCQIETAEPMESAFRARCTGTATVTPGEDSASVVLDCVPAAGGGETGRRLHVSSPEFATPQATWREGMYPDGWIGLNAILDVAFIPRLGLRLFLPRREGLGDKTLAVTHDGVRLLSTPLVRGKRQEIWLDLDPLHMAVARLEFAVDIAEPPKAAKDTRALGCVVQAMNLADDWDEAPLRT